MSLRAHIARSVLMVALLLSIVLLNGCAAQKPHEQFHKPKFETSTNGVEHRGRPSVRQTWFQRFWFWQRKPGRKNSEMRSVGDPPFDSSGAVRPAEYSFGVAQDRPLEITPNTGDR